MVKILDNIHQLEDAVISFSIIAPNFSPKSLFYMMRKIGSTELCTRSRVLLLHGLNKLIKYRFLSFKYQKN